MKRKGGEKEGRKDEHKYLLDSELRNNLPNQQSTQIL